MAGSGRTGSRRRATAADVARSESRRRPDQREPSRRRQTTARSRRSGRSAARTISSIVGDEIRNVTDERRPAGHVALRQGASSPGRARGNGWRAIFANRIPKTRGRIALCHLLSGNGGVRAEFTVYEWAPGQFYLVSAGALERHDHDILRKLLPKDGSVRFQPITTRLRRAGARRPALARSAAEAHRHRPLQRRLPLAVRQADLGRADRRARAARQLRRRTRLGAASPDRDAERHFRPADGGGRANSASSPSASGR